jgi:hypothetical protein
VGSVRSKLNAANIRLRFASAILAMIGSAAVDPVHAVEPAEIDAKGAFTFGVSRYVIAGGGGQSSGGVFAIQGTIGQADADPLQPASGGALAVTGGFWPGIAPPAPPGDAVFANGFETGAP